MAIWKPTLAPSEICSDFTLSCKGVVSVLSWGRSANKYVPVGGRERKPVLTLQDLCLLNQTERKYPLLRTHPFASVLQRAVELRCPSPDCLYPWARKPWRSRACFSPLRPSESLSEEKLMELFWRGSCFSSLSCCSFCSLSLLSFHSRRAGARQALWQIKMS